MKTLRLSFGRLLVASAIFGVLTHLLVQQRLLGLNFVLLTALWGAVCLYFAAKKSVPLRRPILYISLAFANALIVFFRASPTIQFWSVVCTLALLLLTAASVSYWDFANSSLSSRLLLVRNFATGALSAPGIMLSRLKRLPFVKKSLPSTGIVLAVLLGVVFVVLFVSADAVLGHFLGKVFQSVSSLFDMLDFTLLQRFLQIIFWSVLSFGVLVTVAKSLHTKHITLSVKKELRAQDTNLILSVLVTIFAVFIGLQVRYLLLRTGLPEGITYANYARQGYGQLLIATFLAAAVIKYLLSTTRSAVLPRSSQKLASTLIVLNILIVITAWIRLGLYVSAYGLTMPRVIAHMGLISIIIGCIVLILWTWGRINSRALYAANFYALLGVLMIAALLNPEAIIAKQNINLAEHRKRLDTSYLRYLSADSWPATCLLPDLPQTSTHERDDDTIDPLSYSLPGNSYLSSHFTNTDFYRLRYQACAINN